MTKVMCVYCRDVHAPSKCSKITDVATRKGIFNVMDDVFYVLNAEVSINAIYATNIITYHCV